ncbi:MAG: DUF6311 domain-containing protein, partial [Noviherbaspirillum sp.]
MARIKANVGLTALRSRLDAGLALLIGLIAFLLTTGGRILNPKYTDWLLGEQDPPTFFLGWHFFRNSPMLQLPLGANPDYGMEIGSSIVFSDSIPLLALILQPFSGVLPETFQYIGLWVMLCFALQALFAYRLLGRFTPHKSLMLVGSAFFALAPVLLWRLYGHYALCGQWVILAALYFYFAPGGRYGRWLALLCIAALIHAYLLIMVGAVWGSDLVQRMLRREVSLYGIAIRFATGAVAVAAVMWLAGYFMVGNDGVRGIADVLYRMNLLSPIDPEKIWSRLLPNQPQTDGDYEGFAYPGIGMLMLGLWAFYEFVRKPKGTMDFKALAPLFALGACLCIYAASNHVAIGEHELFAYTLPPFAERIAGIFRATGRLFWPVYYMIYLAIFYVVFTRVRQRAALLMCAGLLCVQIADSTVAFDFFRNKFNNPKPVLSLQSPLWNAFPGQYKHVVYVLPYNLAKHYVPLAYFAASNRMTINVGYFARVDLRKQEAARQQVASAILSNRL